MPSKSVNTLVAILLLGMLSSALHVAAQADRYALTPGKTDTHDMPLTGASVCLKSRPSECFQMPNLRTGDVIYQFALEPEAKTLGEANGSPLLLFGATFSAQGSGTLTRYAILREENAHLTNLLPGVALTNQSDHSVWNEPRLSPYPILVTADFIWNFDAGETHFSKHHFTIDVWRYDKASDLYAKVLSYRTARKYDGLDDVDKMNVIAPERPEVLRRLATLTNNP